MLIIWGTHSDVQDLGVVAELCPGCGAVTPCRVFGHVQGMHIFFVPVVGGVTEAVSDCGRCGQQFKCESWRYKAMVPASEAISLSLEGLMDRTNPALMKKLEWSRRCEEFGADPRFGEVLRAVDELRPGSLKTRLSKGLRRWDRLDEGQREDLTREASVLACAMRFALSISAQIPSNAGCAMGFFICVAVWVALFCIPEFWNHGLKFGVCALVAGPVIGGMVYQFLATRHVRRWTREVLVPQGRKSGVDLQQFAALLGDLPPPNSRAPNALSPLQEHAATIRTELLSFEKKNQEIRMWDGV